MAGERPDNLLNAAQIRELLSRIPSRITDPQGDEVYDYRAIRTTQGRWSGGDRIWTRDEREALEATYEHYTGQRIDLVELHRSEYEQLEKGLERAAGQPLGPNTVLNPTAIVSADGDRNFDLDKSIIDRVISDLSDARVHRTGMPQTDVANIRALYVAYGMEKEIYGERTTNLAGEVSGGAANATPGRYTTNELNRLGELRRQILHKRVVSNLQDDYDQAEPEATIDDAALVTDETNVDGLGLPVRGPGSESEIEVTLLPPLGWKTDPDLNADITIEPIDIDPVDTVTETRQPDARMTIIGDGTKVEAHVVEMETLQTHLSYIGYDIGTYPEGHAKAGEPMIDGLEGPIMRTAIQAAQTDLKELGIEMDPRTTPLTEFIAKIQEPETELRLRVLLEGRQMDAERDGTAIDYRDRATERALTEGLSSQDAFDEARADTSASKFGPDFDMSVPTEEPPAPGS